MTDPFNRSVFRSPFFEIEITQALCVYAPPQTIQCGLSPLANRVARMLAHLEISRHYTHTMTFIVGISDILSLSAKLFGRVFWILVDVSVLFP